MATSKKLEGAPKAPGFAATIKPYFSDCYRNHMNSADMVPSPFDLWSAAAVQKHWTKIRNAVRAGYMPPDMEDGCEGSWDKERIEQFLKDFQEWKDGGFQP